MTQLNLTLVSVFDSQIKGIMRAIWAKHVTISRILTISPVSHIEENSILKTYRANYNQSHAQSVVGRMSNTHTGSTSVSRLN